MSASSSTLSATTSTTAAVVSVTNASQSATVTSSQQYLANAANQVTATALSKEQRIAELATKNPKSLSLMLRKAKEKGNTDRIAEIEAARAIRHAKHEQTTGQKVASHATAAATASEYDSKSAAKADATAAKDTATAPNVKPETLQKYKTNVDYAKLVISLAVDGTKALEQLEVTDASNAEVYRMARCLRNPFLAEERAQVEMAKILMPDSYRGAKSNADVFKNMIASDLAKPLARLQMRLVSERQFGDASTIALTLLAIEKKQSK